jgi:hypothetical protein
MLFFLDVQQSPLGNTRVSGHGDGSEATWYWTDWPPDESRSYGFGGFPRASVCTMVVVRQMEDGIERLNGMDVAARESDEC